MNDCNKGFWKRGPQFVLDARRIAIYLAVPTLCVLMIQLALGASPLVVMLTTIITLTGLLGFAAIGAYNAGAWLLLFFVLGNVLVSLYAKTLLGQPLDSNLYAPVDSFLVLMITSLAMLVALTLVRFVPLGKILFKPTSDPRLLRFLSWGSFVLGTLFWFINRQVQDDSEGSGFGGFALFQNLLLMGVIARTALLLQVSEGQRSIDLILTFLLAASVLMGLLDNAKTDMALPIVSYFVTTLIYRGAVTLRLLTVLVVGGILFAVIVGPMVHIYRAAGVQDVPLAERVGLIAAGFKTVVVDDEFSRIRELANARFESGYYDYFGGGKGQMVLGRYASVQQVDSVIATVNSRGILGGRVIWPSLSRLLPRFLDSNKPEFADAYEIVVRLGLIQREGGKFPTVPLAAQAYAGYGIPGIILIPFFTFLGFLLVLKKLGWNLRRNVYAIFFFCQFVIVYANQGNLEQYAGAALRGFPLLGIVLLVLAFASRFRFYRRTNSFDFCQDRARV